MELGHVVAGNVSLEFSGVRPGEPPLSLSVIDDVEMLTLLKAEVLISPGIIVIQSNEHFVLIGWGERS